jgi:Protein of unknown function (DUF2637)
VTAQRPSGGRSGRDGRDWLDAVIEWASGATAAGMFAYGVALSYSVLHAIAAAAGLPAWSARLWPLGFEAFMAASALNALAEQRRRRHLAEWWQRVPWYPWTLTGLTAGGSLLLNWFHPAIPLDPPPGWLRSLVYGLPPLAAVFAWHLFLQRIAHRRPAAVEAASAADTAAVPSWQHDHATVPVHGDRKRATAGTGPGPGPREVEPGAVPAPAAADGAGRGSSRRRGGARPSRPSGAGTGAGPAVPAQLVARAAAVAEAFQAEHGRPISRDALGRALRVGNRTAGELLRAVRAAAPPAQDGRPAPDGRDGDGTVPAPSPATPPTHAATPSPVPVPAASRPAGNGTGPDDPAPPSLSSSRSPARVS